MTRWELEASEAEAKLAAADASSHELRLQLERTETEAEQRAMASNALRYELPQSERRTSDFEEALATAELETETTDALRQRLTLEEDESRSEAAGAHRESIARDREAEKVSRLEGEAEGQRILIQQLEATARLMVPRSSATREVESLARARENLAAFEEQCVRNRTETEAVEQRLAVSEESSSASLRRATERHAAERALAEQLRAAATLQARTTR